MISRADSLVEALGDGNGVRQELEQAAAVGVRWWAFFTGRRRWHSVRGLQKRDQVLHFRIVGDVGTRAAERGLKVIDASGVVARGQFERKLAEQEIAAAQGVHRAALSTIAAATARAA
jgi:hypothetical protein